MGDAECAKGQEAERERTLETRKVPRPLMACMRSNVLTLVLCESVSEMAEALLMTMSMPPNLDAVSSIACRGSSARATGRGLERGEGTHLCNLVGLPDVDDEREGGPTRLLDGLGGRVDGAGKLGMRLGPAARVDRVSFR